MNLRAPRARAALTILATAAAMLSSAGVSVANTVRAEAPSARFAAGVVLVGFHDGTTAAAEARIVTGAGAIDERTIGQGTHVLRVPPGAERAVIDRLLMQSDVRYAEPNYVGSPLSAPNDPDYGQQWALDNTGQTVGGVTGTPGADVNTEGAWSLTTGTAQVVIAIADDGIPYLNADLAANVWSNPGGVNGCPAGTHGYDSVLGVCDPNGNGHGAGVAGVAGQVGNNGAGGAGLAWTTSLMGLKFAYTSPSQTALTKAIEAIDWAVRAKQAFDAGQPGANVRLINISWDLGGFSQAVLDEIKAAGDADILVVAASGNDGREVDDADPLYPCSYDAANVICVGGTDQNDASIYNWGPHVDLAAPATNLYTLGGALSSGTSGAAPLVSGAAALLLAHEPTLTAVQVKDRILANVKKLPALSGKVATGGRLDVGCAMTSCAPPPPTTTTTEPTTTTTEAATTTTTTTTEPATTTTTTSPPTTTTTTTTSTTTTTTPPTTTTTSPPTTTTTTTTTPPTTTTTPSGSGGGGGGGTTAASVSTTTTTTTSTPPRDPVTRLAGLDRIDTAIAASRQAFGDRSASSVVLSRSDSYADALAGTPLAVDKQGPLLLTGRDLLDGRVIGEIGRVLRSGGTVYLLGGTAALSPSVEDELRSRGYRPVRFAGRDRYATAVAIAEQGLGSPPAIIEGTGLDFADALVAGAAAAKIHGAVLLTAGSSLPEATAGYLARHATATRYALGGPAAAADPIATAIVGVDRYDTARRVAKAFFTKPAAVGTASAWSFADALAGGVHIAGRDAPLLLVPTSGNLPASVATYLTENRDNIDAGWVYGGGAAVPDSVVVQVQDAIT